MTTCPECEKYPRLLAGNLDAQTRAQLVSDRVAHIRAMHRTRKPKILSVRACKALDFIIRYKCQNDGNSPSIREIGDAIGTQSTSLIDYYLNELQDAGRITRPSFSARMICVVGGAYIWQKPEAQP